MRRLVATPLQVREMFNVTMARPHKARISVVDRLEYFLRSRASKVVVLALVANTMVAQLLYNSAGQLVLGSGVLLGYLLISACCSTLAFALFEVSTIFQLHDLMALDPSIKREIGAASLIRRGYVVLAVSSVINFLSVLYFLALAWHTGSGVGTKFPLDDLPQPWNWRGPHTPGNTATRVYRRVMATLATTWWEKETPLLKKEWAFNLRWDGGLRHFCGAILTSFIFPAPRCSRWPSCQRWCCF